MTNKLLDGTKDGLAHALRVGPGGKPTWSIPSGEDIRALRDKLQMTQLEFAQTFGFDLSAVRNWEQRRATPERAKSVYLKMIETDPVGVMNLLKKVEQKETKNKSRKQLERV